MLSKLSMLFHYSYSNCVFLISLQNYGIYTKNSEDQNYSSKNFLSKRSFMKLAYMQRLWSNQRIFKVNILFLFKFLNLSHEIHINFSFLQIDNLTIWKNMKFPTTTNKKTKNCVFATKVPLYIPRHILKTKIM